MKRSPAPRDVSVFEGLESRRLFCGDGTATPPPGDDSGGGGDSGITTRPLPVLRAGSFAGTATDSTGAATALSLRLATAGRSSRTSSALLGSLNIVTRKFGTLRANVTTGVMQANRTLQFTFSGKGFKGTFTGKTNSAGSLLQGKVVITGGVKFAASSLKLTKV